MSALGPTLKMETTWQYGQPVVKIIDAPDYIVCDLEVLINSGDLVQYHCGVITFANQVSYEISGWDSDWKTVTMRKVKE